jgi:phosphoserine phosphatase
MPGNDPASQNEQLKLLLDVTRHMASTTELVPLLEKVAAAACQVLRCERATVFLLDRERNELYSKVATGAQEIRFPATMGIAGEVSTTGRICNVPDAYADPRFNPEIDRRLGFRTRNMLTFPLHGMDNERIGVLQVLNKHDGPFLAEDEELAMTLSAQTGVAIQRQILLDEYAQKQQMERELDLARSIQQKLLPEENPRVAGYQIAGWNKPAEQTGGDIYNFLPATRDRLALVLADATGHGIGAALIIAQFNSMLRATAGLDIDLAQVMTRVNSLLANDLPADRFVTTFVGTLDPAANRIEYIAAGQGPLIHFRKAMGRSEILLATDVPLGIMPDIPFESGHSVEFAPGDIFCLLTDGFFEWASADREQFGDERVIDCLARHCAEPPARLIDILYEEVVAFSGGTPQDDDLTAIIIRRDE